MISIMTAELDLVEIMEMDLDLNFFNDRPDRSIQSSYSEILLKIESRRWINSHIQDFPFIDKRN